MSFVRPSKELPVTVAVPKNRYEPVFFDLRSLIAAALLVLVLGACSTTPQQDLSYPFEFETTEPSTEQIEHWLQGESPHREDDIVSAEGLFLAGEISYWDGDLEDAYQQYVKMLQRHPGHALNRYAAYRLMLLRHDVIDFSARMASDLQAVRFDDETALTRLELARLSLEITREDWQRSASEEPFSFASAGWMNHWTATPVLSPWRLLDFDAEMAPEKGPELAESYRSPQVATDDANWEPTQIVALNRPRQSLDLGGAGIYYLESQLTVEGDERRSFTLSGHFPAAARVWVNGEQVLERTEHAYETGRLLRQLELEPGDHRVLVKFANQPGSRDWFELLFVPTTGDVLGDAGVGVQPWVQGEPAGLRVVSPTFGAEQLEPVQLGQRDVEQLSGPTLYAAALSAHASRDGDTFTPLWEALMERYPDFAPGYLLGSYQVRTRWDMPSQLRDATAMSRLRKAEAVDPDNLHLLVQLERRLRDMGEDREHRRVLKRSLELTTKTWDRGTGESTGAGALASASPSAGESGAHDGEPGERVANQLRQLRPHVSWARYLEDKGWSSEAEDAWRQVLNADPGHCMAAQRLQGLYRSRLYFPDLEEITPDWITCPRVISRWTEQHPDRLEEGLELAARKAHRYPYDAGHQRQYARALKAVGQIDEANRVLDEAIDRMPKEHQLWRARIEYAMEQGDDEQARELVFEAIDRYGRSARFEWTRARLDDEIPLQELLRDGKEAAMEEVRRTGGVDDVADDIEEADEVEEVDDMGESSAMALDDAYYVVDFAGRKYFEDGSSWTLTHQVIRVMTRGAIDRYAELTVPGNADLLMARTIKEDGEVRMPAGVSGDSTLSMPGLARGDMLEVAYLQFRSPSRINNHIDGTRFYFQMPNVSSRHSEYVVVGTQEFDFESANGAPTPEHFEYRGRPATRFVATDMRHPRSEPRRVSSEEYLPWVREISIAVDGDVLDVERRYMRESLRGSARSSTKVDQVVQSWLGDEYDPAEIGDAQVQDLFYGAARWFRNISSGAFRTDATHGLRLRRGSPIVVLHRAFTDLGIEHDVYVARSDEESPLEQQVGEISRYHQTVMKVTMPESGQTTWLQLDRRDAMFGAVEAEIDGQPALCITCDELRREMVSMEDERRPHRHIDVEAQLDDHGTLTGTIDYVFRGSRAVRVRSSLRARSDEEDRRSYFERVLTDRISGADLTGYSIEYEDEPDRPLQFSIDFQRDEFARVSDDRLVVDQPLFREAMQRIYTRPATRTTPMFVGYEREQSYSLNLALPKGAGADLRATDVEAATTPFGDFHRRTWIDDDVLYLESSIRLPRQRISAGDYSDFREWTRLVEESASLWLELTLPEVSADLGDGLVESVDG